MNMNAEKLFAIIDQLKFPEGQWVVFGGACLTARNIRQTPDLEIFVTEELYASLASSGWEAKVTGSTGANYLTKITDGYPVLVFMTCGSEKWRPNVTDYLKNPELISDMPFMPLTEMYAWKASTARPKDLKDLTLIKKYQSSKPY
jgi:hypothetical protein